MGVPGLLPLLREAMRPVRAQELSGQRVAVDGYVWLHRGLIAAALDLGMGRESTKHVDYCIQRIDSLVRQGAHVMMVFDGAPLPSKEGVEGKRAESRETNRAAALRCLRQGNLEGARQAFSKALDVTPRMAAQVIERMRERFSPSEASRVVAPFEADAQLAFLAKEGLVDVVITEDSDCIPYGVPRIIFKWDSSQGVGTLLELSNIFSTWNQVNLTQFSPDMIVYACILSGCDYSPGVPGIGLKKAIELVGRHGGPPRLLRALRYQFGKSVRQDFEQEFMNALDTFRHQVVYDPRSKTTVFLSPLSSGDVHESRRFGCLLEPTCARLVAEGRLDPVTCEAFEAFEVAKTKDETVQTVKCGFNQHDVKGKQSHITKYFAPETSQFEKKAPARVKDGRRETAVASPLVSLPPQMAAPAGARHATEGSPTATRETGHTCSGDDTIDDLQRAEDQGEGETGIENMRIRRSCRSPYFSSGQSSLHEKGSPSNVGSIVQWRRSRRKFVSPLVPSVCASQVRKKELLARRGLGSSSVASAPPNLSTVRPTSATLWKKRKRRRVSPNSDSSASAEGLIASLSAFSAPGSRTSSGKPLTESSATAVTPSQAQSTQPAPTSSRRVCTVPGSPDETGYGFSLTPPSPHVSPLKATETQDDGEVQDPGVSCAAMQDPQVSSKAEESTSACDAWDGPDHNGSCQDYIAKEPSLFPSGTFHNFCFNAAPR